MKLTSNLLQTWYTCSLRYDLSNFNAKLEILPEFHGPLNIENDSASGAFVYWGHILVYSLKEVDTHTSKKKGTIINGFI